MEKRGRLPNLSTFAFAATPKPKTLDEPPGQTPPPNVVSAADGFEWYAPQRMQGWANGTINANGCSGEPSRSPTARAVRRLGASKEEGRWPRPRTPSARGAITAAPLPQRVPAACGLERYQAMARWSARRGRGAVIPTF